MSKEALRDEMHNLRERIKQLNHLYYNESISQVTDAVYDSLKQRLTELENEWGVEDWASPTNTVGAPVVGGHFQVVRHLTPMLSLANVYDEHELKEWIESLPEEATISSEPKIDGLSLDLVYFDGALRRAITRGDGIEGEDVTENALNVWGVQHTLGQPAPAGIFEVRGEVYIAKEAFTSINEGLLAAGKKPYANARNYASGSLRLKNPEEVLARRLKFVSYDYIYHGTGLDNVQSKEQQLLFYGFDYAVSAPVSERVKKSLGSHALRSLLEDMLKARHNWSYEIDGMVFKVNEPEYRRQLGSRLNNPRWAVAYKFPAEDGSSILRDILWQVGKSGVVTPVAVIDPVRVAGVTITNVTLHNVAEIERLELLIGDHIVVTRRGDVIPKIEGVLTELRTGNEEAIHYPERCPACEEPLTRMTHSIYCTNNSGCPDQSVARMAHFASRGGMNIKGLGDAAITELVRNHLVMSFSSLFYLSDQDLAVAIKSDKTRAKVLQAIADAKHRPFHRVIFAIGIPEVGEGTAERLAEHYNSFEELCNATRDDLKQIPDIGDIVSESIYENCQLHRKEYLGYDKLFTYVKEPETETAERDLEGQVVVVSGNGFMIDDTYLSRAEMEKNVKARGAKLVSSISSNVDLFFCGTNAGPEKVRKAKNLGFTQVDPYIYENPLKESTHESAKDSDRAGDTVPR